MKLKKINKFIDTYENKIKYIREDYYNKISQVQYNETLLFLENSLNILPFIIAIFILIFGDFSITSVIVALLVTLIHEVLKELFFNKIKIKEKNEYLKEIKKLKFKSIEDYEKNIKEYITGKNGYYNKLLNTLIDNHHINKNTNIIQTNTGESYYIWLNKKETMMFLLNNNTNSKPALKRIKMQNIRYYRYDKDNKNIILYTIDEMFILKEDSLEIFDTLIPSKKYETSNTFSPEEYIKDFELFIHKEQKREINKNNSNKKFNENIILLISILTLIITTIIKNMYKLPIWNIITLILVLKIIFHYKSINNILIKKDIKSKNIMNIIINKTETKLRFFELKKMLNIKNTYESIFTNEGERIILWKNNNYLHMFFNEITNNIKYIVAKTKDISYSQNDKILLHIKNKKIELRKDALTTLKKYL